MTAARVTIDRAAGTVTKAFPPGSDGAAVEHERLVKLWATVQGIDGVTCPRPLGVTLEPVPALTMTLAEGRPMIEHLADRSTDPRFVARLATLLVTVAEAHGEALPDLHFRNMLHAEGPDEVVLLDLGDPPDGGSATPGRLGPAEASIARLAGSTLFECTRPRSWFRFRANVATARAARATVLLVADRSEVRATALATRRHLARGGPVARRLWYRTAGAALALAYRRLVLPG